MKVLVILCVLAGVALSMPQAQSVFERRFNQPAAYNSFAQGQYNPNQYKPNQYKPNRYYNSEAEGQYRPDNSGAYNSQDGQYHPDESGAYRPDGAGGYNHQDNPYSHKDGGYVGYKDDNKNYGGSGGAGSDGSGAGGAGGAGGSGSGDRYTGGFQPNAGLSGGNKYPGGSPANAGLSGGNRYPGGSPANAGLSGGNRYPGGSPANAGNSGNRLPTGGAQVGAGAGVGNQGSTFGVVTSSPVTVPLKQGNAAGLYDNRNYAIIRKVEHVEQDGYHYLYETENGILGEEDGHLEQKGTDLEAMKAKGFFEYTGPDSVVYRVEYTADENGFHPVGAHLPEPPAIPLAIVRSLEYQKSLGEL